MEAELVTPTANDLQAASREVLEESEAEVDGQSGKHQSDSTCLSLPNLIPVLWRASDWMANSLRSGREKHW